MIFKVQSSIFTALLYTIFMMLPIVLAQETEVQLDLAHLEKNSSFTEWEGECPVGWRVKELTAHPTDESFAEKPVLELSSETGHGVFCQISSEVAKLMHTGDTLVAEIYVRNVADSVAEIYMAIESDESGKPELVTISQILPSSMDWQPARISWLLDKSLAPKDGHFLRVVYGVRFKSTPSPKPFEVCAPRFWLNNMGL